MTLIGLALAAIMTGGIFALVTARWHSVSSALAVAGVVIGAVIGSAAALGELFAPSSPAVSIPWMQAYGPIRVALDPLSAFFLLPIFVLSSFAAVFGRGYLGSIAKRRRGVAWFAFDFLVASMVCVVIARQSVFFLLSWEVMSVCSYLLITFDHEEAEVRRAGWVYLIAAHVGTACLLAAFLLMARHAGGYQLDKLEGLPAGLSSTLFILAIIGFGVKAGVVPLHVWLPEAHAAAPSHVSALMSGVVIKMGAYGILRTLVLIGNPAAWWGPSLVVLGVTGALLGITLAVYQRDLKRVLAYSSVENMGIVITGIGTGYWGLTSHRPYVAVLGMTGALLHVWNHGLMKTLLFLSAGSVVHATRTKDLEKLGGLMKVMPRTGRAMTLGAVAIAALPPLNGFVGEWLVYLGLARSGIRTGGAASVAAALAIGSVALAGALTVLCFVRLVGIALLGEARSDEARHAHESPASMTVPISTLAVVCVAAGLTPHVVARLLAPTTFELLSLDLDAQPPLVTIASINGVLLAIVLLGWLAVRRLGARASEDATWGCGYAAPTARMQYTSRSFTENMGERLIPALLRPRVTSPKLAELFPETEALSSECDDPITRGVYEPFLARFADRIVRIRWLQQGVLHAYIFYILLTALVLITWASFRSWLGP